MIRHTSSLQMEAKKYFQSNFLSFKDKLYRFAYFFMKNEDDAADVVQEVYLKVWDNRDKWDTLQNEEAWCMQVTKNLCLERKRKTKTIREHHTKMTVTKSDAHEKSPENISLWKDQMQMMHNILDKLSEKQKIVFVLREIEGLSYKEITEQLDIELNQVKTDLHRARKYLRAELSKINDHGISRYQSIM